MAKTKQPHPSVPCPTCAGTGKLPSGFNCTTCYGVGRCASNG